MGVSAFDLLAGFAKDNNEDRAQKVKERGEELREQRLLYQQIAMNRYATDEKLYGEHQKKYLERNTALSSLGGSATKDEIAAKLAVLDGRNIDGADEKQRAFILQSYYGDIEEQNKKDSAGKDMLDADGNILKQLIYNGNHEPIAPKWGKKYYNSQTFFDAKDNIESGTKGKWTTAIRGEGFDTGDQVLATLQNDLEMGAKRNVQTWDNYFEKNNNVFDAKEGSLQDSSPLDFSDLYVNATDKQRTLYQEFIKTNTYKLDDSARIKNIAGFLSSITGDDNAKFLKENQAGEQVLTEEAMVMGKMYKEAYETAIHEVGKRIFTGNFDDENQILPTAADASALVDDWFKTNYMVLENDTFTSKGNVAALYVPPSIKVNSFVPSNIKDALSVRLNKVLQFTDEELKQRVKEFQEVGIRIAPVNQTADFAQWKQLLDAESKEFLGNQTLTDGASLIDNEKNKDNGYYSKEIVDGAGVRQTVTGLVIPNPGSKNEYTENMFIPWQEFAQRFTQQNFTEEEIKEYFVKEATEQAYYRFREVMPIVSSTNNEEEIIKEESKLTITQANFDDFKPPKKWNKDSSKETNQQFKDWNEKYYNDWKTFIQNIGDEPVKENYPEDQRNKGVPTQQYGIDLRWWNKNSRNLKNQFEEIELERTKFLNQE